MTPEQIQKLAELQQEKQELEQSKENLNNVGSPSYRPLLRWHSDSHYQPPISFIEKLMPISSEDFYLLYILKLENRIKEINKEIEAL